MTDAALACCHISWRCGFVRSGPMKARQILNGASFAPEQLRVLFEAFDRAWAAIAVKVGDDPQAIEAARLKLANLILGLARDGNPDDPERLKTTALQLLSIPSGS